MATRAGVLLGGLMGFLGLSAIAYYAFSQWGGSLQTEEKDSSEDNSLFPQEEGKVTVVDNYTTVGVLQAILLRKNILDYTPRVLYEKDKLFKDSPEISIKTKEIQSPDGKKLTVLDMDEEVKAFKESCIKALKETSKEDTERVKQLKEWCTVPSVKKELENRGFEITKDNDHYKHVRNNSRWFVNDKGEVSEYTKRLKFLLDKDLDDSDFNKNPENRALRLQIRCMYTWEQEYSINSIPSVTIEEMDNFQKVTMFCVKPITAAEYLAKEYKITEFEDIDPVKDKEHFCYVEGKTLEDYKNFKTYDNMGDKNFWCVVRFLYDKRKVESNPSWAYI